MAFKWGNTSKSAGDTWIGFGGVLCVLSFLVFMIGSFNGVPNGLTLTGGVIMGLLMIIAGYLKRITVALTARNTAAPDKATPLNPYRGSPASSQE